MPWGFLSEWVAKPAGKPGFVQMLAHPDSHSSRPIITDGLMQPTRRLDGPFQRLLLGLAPDGVYRAARLPGTLVRSYRTVSPLPVPV
ncbi:hypothetical protein GCM10010971_14920 [Silvimonas amylolytica]|uniref:Uncharacterized protein n=1 Tax=Silvimonas amylolytica TaxID=449663 RepID=A0ABQ2PK05_9NEIS|nr:hypothetical protein GCM10010971_14920 [Silvimonas amylolytica]